MIKINNCTIAATVTELKHMIDINTLSKLAAKTLALNEVGVCNLSVARAIAFDSYSDNRDTGAFILIDRYSNETVAAGMIDFALRRATNIHHHKQTVSKAERTHLMHHRPAVLWFTGLPGAGKSTIANLVEAALHARGVHTILLDGDNVRHGLNRDLGFTEPDRVENIRRIGEVAKLMTNAGLIVLCSFISPFQAERRMVREQLDAEEFIEIFVDTPIERCIARDPKGLYARALAGEIKNFTGVDQPYEAAGKSRTTFIGRSQGSRPARERSDRGAGAAQDFIKGVSLGRRAPDIAARPLLALGGPWRLWARAGCVTSQAACVGSPPERWNSRPSTLGHRVLALFRATLAGANRCRDHAAGAPT